MRKILALGLISVMLMVGMVSMSSMVYGKPNGGFGKYVSTLSKSRIPYAMDKLGLHFGKIFVAPFTPATELDPTIYERVYSNNRPSPQYWVISSDSDESGHTDYAVQWYTYDNPTNPPREEGHDYVVIWSEEELGADYAQYFWKEYNPNNKGFPLNEDHNYYLYVIDVTK